MTNPLRDMPGLPAFSSIQPEHIEAALDAQLAANRARLDELLKQPAHDFESLARPLMDMDEALSRLWSPVRHMNSVVNGEALRAAYNAGLPKLTDYGTEMGQNTRLFAAWKSLRGSAEYATLSDAQRKIVDDALRDFHLAGVDLPEADKARYKAISQRLSELGSKFDEHVLDATQAWSVTLTDLDRLAGLPDSARAAARQAAEQNGEEGWRFTLDFPSYIAVMTHADDRALRESMYTAFATRASDQGPDAGRFDNSALIDETLKLRHEAARLLGFDNYAQRSLARKMADSPAQVIGFLEDLAARSLPAARRELAEVTAFAAERGCADLQAWDIPYHSEKLRQQRYAISQEELRPYFPAPRVLDGLFQVVERLYDVRVTAVEGIDVWHPDVRFFEIRDRADGELRGQFYLDLYARQGKRGGAWMDVCRSRHHALGNTDVDAPVAYLTCNFGGPVGNRPALLTHDEVITLFHEFGHGLHHMLTRVEWQAVSGIHGVEWDAVELPSQFMENFCWQREALDLLAAHHETGAPLPDDLFERMQAARHFQSAMQMVRQLEFALFDLHIHMDPQALRGGQVMAILARVREQVAVVRPPAFNRFPHAFTHIFSGGYAAGYYSYKWAEVLSADAFAVFEEKGVFDRETGARFLHSVLEKGGSRPAMELFRDFRGREPEIDALLRHSGLAA
ncbi:MAG: oligopeptidase A [Gammaproteobacteria bacterium]|nr:oligopeptidase A [Gammaproteobacteria bacterium]